jgi:putative ABC transport system permease protein
MMHGGHEQAKIFLRRNISLEQGMRYKRLMEVESGVVCLKVFEGGVEAVYGNRKTTPDVNMVGSNEHFVTANQYEVGEGRNLQPEDVDLGRPVAVIGQSIVSKLFPAETPFGKMVKLGGRPYTVVGVFKSKGAAFGEDQDKIAIVPISRFLSDFGAEGRSLNIATQAPTQALYNQTMDRAITAMRVARGLEAEQENDFEVYSNDSLLAAFAKVADVIASGSFVISGIALLAAGVGIMNIMLVSVTERTKEIGIRKSIGARKRSILMQFLLESLSLSVAGGVAGILLGAGFGNLIALMLKASVVFPWDWALVGICVCGAIGVGFGFYPAYKAASLDPIEALRHE